MFCPKCKSLLFPKDDDFVCQRCGYTQKKKGKNIVVSKQKEKEMVVLEGKIDILPKTRAACPKCNNREAYWVLRQTRSSDEPETRIYTCTKCNHTWRAY
ncbi:MAG: transcription factor S [Methanobacteriota archaeon]